MELEIVKIFENEDMIGYGGNQDWFFDEWAKKAGCASVLGSCLYAYYHYYHKMEKKDFLKIMNDLYQCMTPGRMGFPYFYKFAHVFVERMKKDNIYLKPIYLKKANSYKKAIPFIIKSIDEHHPIAVLILTHHAKELEDDNWHWLCLSGYIKKEDGYDFIFSDYGERKVIPAHILFDNDLRNNIKILRFQFV